MNNTNREDFLKLTYDGIPAMDRCCYRVERRTDNTVQVYGRSLEAHRENGTYKWIPVNNADVPLHAWVTLLARALRIAGNSIADNGLYEAAAATQERQKDTDGATGTTDAYKDENTHLLRTLCEEVCNLHETLKKFRCVRED